MRSFGAGDKVVEPRENGAPYQAVHKGPYQADDAAEGADIIAQIEEPEKGFAS